MAIARSAASVAGRTLRADTHGVAYNWTTEWPGVYARHDSNCQLRNGGECTCERVTYRASAKTPDQHSRLLSPELASALEARDWLRDQRARLTAAIAVAQEGPLVDSVITDFLAAAERGEAHERSGAEYTQPRRAQLRAGLTYVESEIGSMPLQAVRRRHVQALIDELHSAGLPSDRIVEVVSSFRDLFVYAIQRDLVDFNPIVELQLPADDGLLVTTATYASPTSTNGNGRHASAPAMVSQPVAAMMSEQPFEAEPTYGPQMPGDAGEPELEEPSPPPPNSPDWPPPAELPHTPPAPPPVPLGSPMGTPFMPPTAPTAGYPYDPAPMFAPPTTRMITPIGAETHYGTPTYGAESVATQPSVQAPRQDAGDGIFMSEQMFWWITRIVVIVFVLIALVLVAESV
jgi:hypothetical protein